MPKVATCLLINNDKLLILKRSRKVRTYKGLWGAVAGYVEENEEPYETAIKEIEEEVGLKREEVKLIKTGKTVGFTDFYEGKKYDWIIYPFLFYVEKKEKIKIDWEHTEHRWISPLDITQYNTVPHLQEIVLSMLAK
ncbi:MAG: hypothetical protein DRN05_07405 [Thermoplasmata archaeon]|nr:MAG: hypothetical protein DRN05_07405 [Thermoplasmata archaeon]